MELHFTGAKLVAILGLAFDVLGAWYISRGLIRKTKKNIVSEAEVTWGPNDNYIINGLVQKIECNVGFWLLLFGFVLQGISTILSGELMNKLLVSWQVLTSLGVELASVLIVYKCSEHIIGKKSKKEILEHVKGVIKEYLASSESPMHPSNSRQYLLHLGINLKEEIPDEEVWNRLLEAIK